MRTTRRAPRQAGDRAGSRAATKSRPSESLFPSRRDPILRPTTTISEKRIRDSGFSISDSGEPGGGHRFEENWSPGWIRHCSTRETLMQIPQTADARASFLFDGNAGNARTQ
jgi:hypothetical protein